MPCGTPFPQSERAEQVPGRVSCVCMFSLLAYTSLLSQQFISSFKRCKHDCKLNIAYERKKNPASPTHPVLGSIPWTGCFYFFNKCLQGLVVLVAMTNSCPIVAAQQQGLSLSQCRPPGREWLFSTPLGTQNQAPAPVLWYRC